MPKQYCVQLFFPTCVLKLASQCAIFKLNENDSQLRGEGTKMATLVDGKPNKKYIITKVNGDHALTARLAELRMNKGKMITVITAAKKGSGTVIYLQGQRLAVSESMGKQIEIVLLDKSQGKERPLADIAVHNACVIAELSGDRPVRKRLMDMGLTRNTLVQVYHVAPLGDPIELQVRGYKLSIRKADAAKILVREVRL